MEKTKNREFHIEDHNLVLIGHDTIIGKGSYLQKGVIIGNGTIIGQNCKIGRNVTIGNHCHIPDNSLIEESAVIGNGCKFEGILHVGVRQCVLPDTHCSHTFILKP